MKKLLFFVSAAMLLGTVACQKDADKTYDGEEGTGKVVVSFDFSKIAGEAETRYTVSAAKPNTTWVDNIKSLGFFLADASGTIKVARQVDLTGSAANATKRTFTFSNVRVGDYTGYLIANYDQAGIVVDFDGTSTERNINTLLMKLATVTAPAGEPAGSTVYSEPAEIFVASRAATNVIANATTDYSNINPFKLTRAISMLRARINKKFDGVSTVGNWTNENIDFTAATAAFRVRKAGTTVDPLGIVTPAAALGTNVIYSTGWNNSTTVPANYTGGTAMLDTDQSAWKDIKIFPGGDTGTGANKFNVVISGMAPTGYIPLGATAKLTTPTLVHWAGTVEGDIAANSILELNIDLKTQGSIDVPPFTETGSIIIGVELAPWGPIEQAPVIEVR